MSLEPDPAGEFIDACVERPDEARRMAAADPSVLYLEKLGSPMLHWFVIEDFPAAAALVIELGVPVDHLDDSGQTALHCASMLGRLGCARVLLKAGADANAYSEQFLENPLNLAVSGQHVDVATLLIDAGAKADYQLPTGETVFNTLSRTDDATRELLTDYLAERGVTREGLFAQLGLGEHYDSVDAAFDW